MTTLFFRVLTLGAVLGGVAACHHGMRGPSFSNPFHWNDDPNGTAQAEPPAAARPSPIPAATPDVVITQLTATPDTDESSPSLAPDGSLVLFMSQEASNRKEKVARTSLSAVDARRATAPSQFSAEGQRALDPTFAPDGKSYFFVSDSMGKWAVVHSSSSSPAAAVTLVSGANAVEPRHPSVSPDGTRVAFAMKKGGVHVIATSDVDGSRLSILGPGTMPTFSPDGTRLVFARAVGPRSQVFTMDAANGRSVTQLTTGEFESSSPAYSPDGAFVAFASNRGAQAKAKNVFVIRADGTQLRQLTNGTHEVRDLSWGRDGSIYFSADPDGTGQLDIFRLESKDFAVALAAPPPPPPAAAPPPSYSAPPPASSAPAPVHVSPTPPPAPVVASGPACGTPEDCENLPCACNDGRIVNTRQCDNRVCTPAQTACESSCRRHAGFTGRLAGAAPAAAQAQPAPAAPRLGVGKTCSVDGECESSVCVFKGSASRGYCTKECQSFTDCPTFWSCAPVRNGSAKYCLQK